MTARRTREWRTMRRRCSSWIVPVFVNVGEGWQLGRRVTLLNAGPETA